MWIPASPEERRLSRSRYSPLFGAAATSLLLTLHVHLTRSARRPHVCHKDQYLHLTALSPLPCGRDRRRSSRPMTACEGRAGKCQSERRADASCRPMSPSCLSTATGFNAACLASTSMLCSVRPPLSCPSSPAEAAILPSSRHGTPNLTKSTSVSRIFASSKSYSCAGAANLP